jgi:cytochrome P450 monooxygenase
MTTAELPALGSDKWVVGRMSPLMRNLQDAGPVVKVRTKAGDEAWLVTRYAELKQLLRDERLGNSHPDPANRPRYLNSRLLDMLVTDTEPAVARETHMLTRSMVTSYFSAKRMSELRPRIAKRAEDLLDGIVADQPPVDLHARLSEPLSFLVLCDLLGVPDGYKFQSALAAAGGVGSADLPSGAETFFDYLGTLVAEKRPHPEEDLISALCESGYTDQQVGMLVAYISTAYLVIPSNLSAGIVLLAANPDQRDKLVRQPELVPEAVEEMLRLAKIFESCVPRYASADIEIGEVVIRAGDLVLCDHNSASHDDRVFDEPERFDVTRSPNPHLAFSYGITHCIGAPLARIEMQEAIGALLRRLPSLHLAVPIEEIPILGGEGGGEDALGGGIAALPVTW